MTISPFYGWNREKPAKPWGWNGLTARNLSILALLALCVIVAGCLPILEEEQYDDSCLRALDGGRAVDISPLNEADHIYTMITAQPRNKPESNDPPSILYQYRCSVTNSNPSQISPSLTPIDMDTADMTYTGPLIYREQAEFDLKLRAMANMALRSKVPQRSRQTRAPSDTSIDEGITKWEVYIAPTNTTITTTCQHVSEYAYFFVEDGCSSPTTPELISYGVEFDRIYELLHDKFGKENNTDGYGPLFIVFTLQLPERVLGYFYPIDKYYKQDHPSSNEADVFYVSANQNYQGNIILGTLAHEFQHMIYFDQHYNLYSLGTYAWLDEALSQAAEFYSGYVDNHNGWIGSFLSGGWDKLSLTHWTPNNYGYGAIFIRYLIEQYGDTITKKMCSTGNVGIAAVEEATRADFNALFNDFTRALVISGTNDTNNPRYHFNELILQDVQPIPRGGLIPRSSYDPDRTIAEGKLYPYAFSFAEWLGDYGTMTLLDISEFQESNSIVGTVFGLSR